MTSHRIPPDDPALTNLFFADLPPDVRYHVVTLARFERVDPLHNFYRQSEEPDAFYIVHSGSVVLQIRGDGRFVTVGTRRAGEPFGHTAILDRSLREENATASGVVEVWRLSRDDFLHTLADTMLAQRTRVLQSLRGASPMGQLPPAALHAIVNRSVVRHFAVNEVILRQDDEADSVLLVRTGELRLVRVVRRPPAPSRVLELLCARAGELVGDDAAMTGRPLAYSVLAAVSSTVLVMDAGSFVQAIPAELAPLWRSAPPRVPPDDQLLRLLRAERRWEQYRAEAAREHVRHVAFR